MPKINYFTPKQIQLEGSGFKNLMKNIFKCTEKMWNNFIKPRLKIATPFISAGVAAKTKNRQSSQITSKNLKSMTGGKFWSISGMQCKGLCLKVM